MSSIEQLRIDAGACTRCDLYRNATTTVFGEGTEDARVVLVGEQPGDQEDLSGRPFVGPAGKVLDRALAASGLDRQALYVTNAVKHFKWVPRGKRRLHQSPNSAEIVACRPWLEGELEVVSPELVVAMGSTAGKALLGPGFRVTAQRGLLQQTRVGGWSGGVVGTIHPSAILRLPGHDQREEEFEAFVSDLRSVAERLASG